MAIPLSEILQAKGDADYAQGGLGGSIPESAISDASVDQYLQHTGDLQYAANKYLAEIHDRNMQQTLKGLGDIDFKDLMPQDRDALTAQYSSHLKDLANNFSTVRNPLSNPQQWAALQSTESAVRNNISQSQQDAAFLQKQQQFVQQHPEFNTPQYQQDVAQFVAAPVGKRNYFTVSPPSVFNPETAYKANGELAKQKYAKSATNGKYITEEEGDKVDMDKYLQNTSAGMLGGVDAYGRPLEQLRKQQFDNLPANLKALYNNDYGTFATKQAQLYAPENQVNKSSIKTDDYGTIGANYRKQLALQNDRQKFEGDQSEADRLNRLEIAGLREPGIKNGKVDKEALGAWKNNIFYQLATGNSDTANVDNSVLQNVYGDNTIVDVKKENQTGVSQDGSKKTTASTTSKLPKISVVGNVVDKNGNIFIRRIDNRTGHYLPDIIRTQEQAYKDLDNLQGEKLAPTVSEAAKDYLMKKIGSDQPDFVKMHALFGQSGTSPLQQYTAPDGKSYNHDALLKLGYTEDQIKEAISNGSLK